MTFLNQYSYFVQVFILIALLALSMKPLGTYMANAMTGKRTLLTFVLRKWEVFFLKFLGKSAKEEMNWKQYAYAVLIFSFISIVIVSLLLYLDCFARGSTIPDPSLILNTSISFVTNTNWQAYAPESDFGLLSQVLSLGVQQFLSPATGICVLFALVKGLSSKNTSSLGNYWVDMVRALLYILLPLAILWGIVFVFLGTPQGWMKDIRVNGLEPSIESTIQMGPFASWTAIEILGTNGGGLFSTNMAHPFQNPNPITHFIGLFLMLLIPSSLCYSFGKWVNDKRQGWALWFAMAFVFVVVACFAHQKNSFLEGKELRIGQAGSTLWAITTTATSNGSTSAEHSSLTPVENIATLFLMQLSEVIFGGVGSGLYTMIVFAILSVFIAGLMVGRTPEYMGKKIGPYDMKMVSIILLLPLVLILTGVWIFITCLDIKAISVNQGAQVFTELLYNVTSAANNNGSAMTGLNLTDPKSNVILAMLMLFGRFWIMIPILALAGSFASKNKTPESLGTIPTHSPLFIGFLIGVLMLVGVLSFVPSLALGPIVEALHFGDIK